MARKRKDTVIAEEKMDMTPLIDCVFLLIMFFILTTEITASVEAVELPFALQGKVAKDKTDDSTILLNIVLKGDEDGGDTRGAADIIVNKEKLDVEKLRNMLQREVTYDMRPPPHGRGRTPESLGETQLSQVKLRIRPDKNAAAEYLRTIFTVCQEVNPKIYKIEISSEKPSGN